MIGIDAVLFPLLALRVVGFFSQRPSPQLHQLAGDYPVFFFFTLLAVTLYIGLALFGKRFSVFGRMFLIIFLAVFSVGTYLGIQLVIRSQSTQKYAYIHDGAVQTEDAIAALRQGQNPYAIDYRNRYFGAFPESFFQATRANPAWTHYVYLPLQVVIGVPLAMISERAFGWFDIRLLYMLSFVIFVACAALLAHDPERRLVVMTLAVFNPVFLPFFISGFNDIFFLGWIALCALMLQKKRLVLAAVALGTAIASKQPAILLFPFFVAHIYFEAAVNARLRVALRAALVTLGTAAVVLLPFFLWSPGDFIDDTIRFAAGSAALSYPISGLGLGQVLVASGFIRSMWDYYPFWIIQAIVGIPLLLGLWRWQRAQPSVARMMMSFGILTSVLLFVSRYFNDSHVAFLLMILLLAYAASSSSSTSRA